MADKERQILSERRKHAEAEIEREAARQRDLVAAEERVLSRERCAVRSMLLQGCPPDLTVL